MNYQIVPFWIYSGRVAFFILLVVLTGFWGMNAFLLYLLFHGIVWQLVVSLRLHTLKEKGLVFNIQGNIPVRIKRYHHSGRKLMEETTAAMCPERHAFAVLIKIHFGHH